MNKMCLYFALVLFGVMLTACGNGNGNGHNNADAEVDPAVLIPNQEGLEEGLEFQFIGSYDTPIGISKVTGNFYNGGEYEVLATIGPYSAFITVGDWQYADNQFTLTDKDTGEVVTSSKDGETYSFSVYLNDTEIVMSATTNGLKEYVILEPKEEETDGQPLANALLSTADSVDQMLRINLFDDNSAVLSKSADASITAEGSWSYSDAGGLQLKIDDSDYDVSLQGDNYEFDGVVSGESRLFSIPRKALEDIANGNLAILFPTSSLPNRYGALTTQQWNDLWADEDIAAEGVEPLAAYPPTSIDGLFTDQLPQHYFTPVAVKDRGAVVRLDYTTQLYQLNEDYGIPQEEWYPITKTCYVYLPAGYSKDTKYNVYYLLHGAGGNAQDWFRMNLQGGATVGNGDFVMLLDYLIANGLMQPTIFVSITPNVDKIQLSKDLTQKLNPSLEISNLIIELESDLVPTVERQFGSYLVSTSASDIVASRKHRAFGGLSLGAYVVWNAMGTNIDSIAYYAPLANGISADKDETETTVESVYGQMRAGDNAKYDVGFIFSQVGVKDHTWDVHVRTNNALYDVSSGDLIYGTNFYMYNPANGTHTAKYFILGVFNSMKVFFK